MLECMDAWMQGLGVGVDGVARRAACEAALQTRHTELVGQGNARLLEYVAYMPSGALDLLEYSAYWSTLTTRPTRVLGRPTGESGSCSGIFGILGTLQYVVAGELGLLEYSKYGSAGPA